MDIPHNFYDDNGIFHCHLIDLLLSRVELFQSRNHADTVNAFLREHINFSLHKTQNKLCILHIYFNLCLNLLLNYRLNWSIKIYILIRRRNSNH